MKVTLRSRYGIGAGLSDVVVNTDRLSPPEAAHLARLVDAARTERQGRREGPAQETIDIEDGASTVELSQPVTDMSAPFAALRSWLRQYGQRARS